MYAITEENHGLMWPNATYSSRHMRLKWLKNEMFVCMKCGDFARVNPEPPTMWGCAHCDVTTVEPRQRFSMVTTSILS